MSKINTMSSHYFGKLYKAVQLLHLLRWNQRTLHVQCIFRGKRIIITIIIFLIKISLKHYAKRQDILKLLLQTSRQHYTYSITFSKN